MADENPANGEESSREQNKGKSASEKGAGTRVVQKKTEAKVAGKTDAVELIKRDHRNIEALFDKFKKARNNSQKKQIVAQIISEFLTHSLIEEKIFYPACREKIDDEQLDEAQVEHDGAKQLVEELHNASPDTPFYDAKVKVLSEHIRHHVAEEERPEDGILAAAVAAGVDIETLGRKIEEHREEIRRQVGQRPPEMPSMGKMHKEQIMAQQDRRSEYGRSSTRYADDDDDRRGSNARHQERDENGRFMSNDDDRNGGSHRGGGGGNGSRGYGRERDEEGRFMSRDDDGRSRSGGGSRYRDDDDRRGGGRGQGGWFGDSEGHSEAARRGWDERGGGSRGRDSDDDRRYSSYSRSNGGGRYRDEDDDRRGGGRGHGGWFGDSEGHAEAARRGWDEREGSSRGRDDDDDRRYGSSSRSGGRYRDDDDDDRRGGGRGHGGWFGDPRGHSEAARRGWEHR
ncbi:MAG: hemerythrin domain-containing protein [Sphingomonas bacterium]